MRAYCQVGARANTRLGLNPDEEVDFAYIVYNLGLDVFYMSNQVYIARQVVTK